MNLKNKLLKHCSIKNVLIVLCILILLYLIYETYVVRENFTGFDDLIDSMSGISQYTTVDDYSKLDMEAICKQAEKLNQICTQCNKTDNTQICFPPDISDNCAYKDLYDYSTDYDVNKVGEYFGNTSYSSITNTDSNSNNIYECKLKYASVDTVELNCDGALKNATLSGCDDVLKLYYKDVSDGDIITGTGLNGILETSDFSDLSKNNDFEISSGEKYFFTSNHPHSPSVYTIGIDISNIEINTITNIKYGGSDISAININDTQNTETLTESGRSSSSDSSELIYKIKSLNINNGLFLYKKSSEIIKGNFYTMGNDATGATGNIILTPINLAEEPTPKEIEITFDTGDGTTTSKLYLFKDPP